MQPLTACRTDRGTVAQAIKISLEVKKYLVDNEHLDISQVPTQSLELLCRSVSSTLPRA